MAILQSRYKIANKNNQFDTYHLETNANMVKVLSPSNQELGDVNSLVFTGQKVTSGNVTDIKLSGLYRVNNLSGLPENISGDNNYLLNVKSIGEDVDNIAFSNYSLIDTDGSIYSKTISGNNDSGWSSGGTKAQESINKLEQAMGNNSGLKTISKNVVGAINELYASLGNANEDLADYSTHNHDTRYIRKDIDSDLSANVNVLNGYGLNIKHLTRGTVNLIKSNINRDIEIGNTESKMHIKTDGDILHNSGRIWSTENHGVGSGLDADKLHGVDGALYVREDTRPFFQEGMKIKDKRTVSFVDDKDAEVAHLATIGSNLIIRSQNGKVISNFNNDGFSTPKIMVTSPSGLTIQGTGSLGFSQTIESNGYAFRNRTTGKRLASVGQRDNHVDFDNGMAVTGRRLYIQSQQPTDTNIPVGSIWIS